MELRSITTMANEDYPLLAEGIKEEKFCVDGTVALYGGVEDGLSIPVMLNESYSTILQVKALKNETADPILENENISSPFLDNALVEWGETSGKSDYDIGVKNKVACNNEVECNNEVSLGEYDNKNKMAPETCLDDSKISHELAEYLPGNSGPLEETSLLLKNKGSEGVDREDDTTDNVLNCTSFPSICDVQVKLEGHVGKKFGLNLTQFIFATVRIEDIFKGNTHKFGQRHSKDASCSCIFCQGKFRVSDWPQFSKSQSEERVKASKVKKNVNSVLPKDLNQKPQIIFEERRIKYKNRLDKKLFICDLCPATCKSQKGFSSHKRSHSDGTRFKCDFCSKQFKRHCTLKEHMLMHSTDRPNKCEHCSNAYKHKKDLISHARLHSGLNIYKCKFCPKFFRAKSLLKMHLRVHTGEKPFSCKLCPATFKQPGQIQVHMRCVHRNEKLFSCRLCSASFKQRGSLNYHTKYSHRSESPFKCKLCPSTFKDKQYLKHHMIRHTNERPWECDACKRKFKTKKILRHHLVLSNSERCCK